MCCGEGGGRERGRGDADTLEVGGGGRSVEFCFGDLPRGEVGVGWSLLFLGKLGWDGEEEDH